MQRTIHYIREELKDLHSSREILEITKRIFHTLRGYSLTDMVLRDNELLTAEEVEGVRTMVGRLKKHEPLQYILGKSEFYGLSLMVDPLVLIPRRETEELVHWIISGQAMPPRKILDIGTGSGCIALALKKAFDASEVEGCDISAGAITLSKRNASDNSLNVNFFEADILDWENFNGWSCNTLIVSNPPYVTEGESGCMSPNVMDYEPREALFVPDRDPLLFYRSIAGFAEKWLSPGGTLYLEINENFGEETVELLHTSGFNHTDLRNDLQGKPRMVKAMKDGSRPFRK